MGRVLGLGGLRLHVSFSWCFNLASVIAGGRSKGQGSLSEEAQGVNGRLGAKGELKLREGGFGVATLWHVTYYSWQNHQIKPQFYV